jgi:sterol desaturase/sphingolipid hydroxylase (fatty acid hydroxylase superfamily)
METFIICAGSIAFFLIIFGFFAFLRYLSYKETLALAEKGLVKPQHSNGNGNGKGALIWGLLITAVGLALTIGLWPLGFIGNTGFPLGFGPWMIVGMIPMFFGLALILIHVLTHERGAKKTDEKTTSERMDE